MPDKEQKIFGLKESHFLVLVFVLSLALRVAYTLFLRLYLKTPIINDENIYTDYALSLRDHHQYVVSCQGYARFTPVFPMLLFVVFKIFGVKIILAGILNSILSSLIPIVMFLTAKRVFSIKAATTACLIAVIYPYYIYYSPLLVTEIMLTLLILLSMLCILRFAESLSYLDLAASAFFLGLSCLTKPIALGFPLLVIAYIFIKAISLKKKLLSSTLYLIVFIALISPWSIRNHLVIGTFKLSTDTGKVFFGGNNFLPSRERVEIGTYNFDGPEIDTIVYPGLFEKSEAERDSLLFKLGVKELSQNYKKIPKLLFLKFIKFWSVRPDPTKRSWTRNDLISLLTYGLILIFFVIGFFKTFRLKEKIFIFHLLIIYFNVVALIFWGTPRFRLPISPYIIMLASVVMITALECHLKKRSCSSANS